MPGEVPETRGMGGRSMSGSSVRFQQEPDVVHFDTDSPAREDRLAIAAPEAVAAPTAVTPPAAEAEAQVPEASIEPAAKAEAQDPEATVEPAAEAEAQDPETVIEPEPAQLLVPEPGITDTPQPLADAAREKVAANLPAAEATDTPPKMEVEVVETQPSAKEAAGLMREAPKEAEDAEAEIAKPSLAAAAGLATAKTPCRGRMDVRDCRLPSLRACVTAPVWACMRPKSLTGYFPKHIGSGKPKARSQLLAKRRKQA